MGKWQRAIVNFFNNTHSRKASKKKLLLSIVSLIFAAVILATSTFCWYMIAKSDGYANDIVLDAGKGLRVNDVGENPKDIVDKSYLIPASSVDGRNLFFPADGTDFSDNTAEMTFRSANVGDMNKNYVQINFELSAEADNTSIYLDDTTQLKIQGSDNDNNLKTAEKALRAAVYYEGIKDNKPIVFSTQNKSQRVSAVDEVDRITGKFIDSAYQTAVPFKEYFYGKKQIASLNQGETRRFSLLIWLEGTDSSCTSALISLKQISLNLVFTTSWDHLATIEFVDMTTGSGQTSGGVYALFNDYPQYKMVLNYNDDERRVVNNKFTMYRDTTASHATWKCSIPDIATKDLTFMIVDSSDHDAVKYKWSKNRSGTSTLNRMTATVYYADTVDSDAGTSNDSRGHWYDGEIEEGGIGSDDETVDDDW